MGGDGQRSVTRELLGRDIEIIKKILADIKDDVRAIKVEQDKLRMAQVRLEPTLNLLRWGGLILGASILGLLWAIFTGQAQILFP